MSSVTVRFGSCEVSLERLELRRVDEVVAMEPQVFEVLTYLLRHRDRVVPKTELLDEIWGNRFVSESALTSRIKSARRAVGDTGRDQRIIRTIYGRGYRFIAEVDEQVPSAGPRGGRAPDDGTSPREHVAATTRVLQVIGDVADGKGATIQIVGPARSGKSEFLDRVADAAARRSLAVGRSAPAPPDPRPFGWVADALEDMAHRHADLLGRIPAECRTELERAFEGRLPTKRQRLFVAAREFLADTAQLTGAVLLLDDFDLADRESLELVDDLARLSRRSRLGIVVVSRPHAATRPGFEVVELPDRHARPADRKEAVDVPPEMTEVLRRLSVIGERFDQPEFIAATAADERGASRLFDLALRSGVIVPRAGVYRFADQAAADRLASTVPAHQRRSMTKEIAARLVDLGAAPSRIAYRFLAAEEPAAAVPYVLTAARTAASAGLHDEVLRWTDTIREYVDGPDRAALLSMRADALTAVGDQAAVAAYRQALAAADVEQAPGLRARLARGAIVSGDLASAQEALVGLETSGGPDDGAILLARGMLAYFSGDLDSADSAVEAARELALRPGAPDRLLDVITLQGMIAHNRGEWFDRLLRELRATSDNPQLAGTVFDSHLCVAEYLLYGPTPYDEVVVLAHQLQDQAERAGARRGVAFAVTVAGEAALLAGKLGIARADLSTAVALHVEISADTGTAHTLQRLAEVELAFGDRGKAERLLRRALPLARWSPLARHLLQRIYGTLIAAAPDADSALAVVDEAVERLDEPLACMFCQVMIAVPASIACVGGGRLDEARAWLAQAVNSAARWQGTAWQASTTEARSYLARAEGDEGAAERLLTEAAELFTVAEQPMDAMRCLEAARR